MKIGPWTKMIAPTLALIAVIGMTGTAQAHKKKVVAHTTTPMAKKAPVKKAVMKKAVMKKAVAKKTAMKGHLTGYKTEMAAKAACGTGGVAWHATGSKVFHIAGSKYFGKTKHGAYVCEKTALATGVHKATN